DTVNTATALAYQDIYFEYHRLKKYVGGKEEISHENLLSEMEKLMDTLYIPQFIRHIQILFDSMIHSATKMYLKIGTTGTGGMGLNIPYTHSEEKPSRVLLSKSALAGAHSMLLFLMGRTPGGPIVKEIKPAAAIAWKGIEYGKIKKHGKTVQLYDCSPENAETLGDTFRFDGEKKWENLNKPLKSVYIDTGENGIFSLGEFEAITTAGQMEFVTPEEIAHNAVMEILGSSTGTDIINALDNSIMGPTYRAGYMRDDAIRKMIELCDKNESDSVAFEILGPPRLSKLLHEAYLIKKVIGTIENLAKISAEKLIEQTEKIVLENQEIRSQAISIGIPILLSDGKRMLRGPNIVSPKNFGTDTIPMTAENIEKWADAGWVDLRKKNIEKWIGRANQILTNLETVSRDDTSSRYHHGHVYWAVEKPIAIGKLAAWIFIHEDKGKREKR
ncbi:MAG: short-chain dehydrogenase, partial [Candidatus Marinimicrobia bacterium]|nr:short-chain dehydrogenase [Candidatus Neomarinimicrobiota bacterium]